MVRCLCWGLGGKYRGYYDLRCYDYEFVFCGVLAGLGPICMLCRMVFDAFELEFSVSLWVGTWYGWEESAEGYTGLRMP